MAQLGGFLTYNGHILAPEEDTFSRIQIPDKGELVLSCGVSVGKPKEWRRFKEYVTNDYFYLDSNYWDAVSFVPNCKIYCHGFGVFSNYHQKDMGYFVKILMDGETPDGATEYEVAKPDSEKND